MKWMLAAPLSERRRAVWVLRVDISFNDCCCCWEPTTRHPVFSCSTFFVLSIAAVLLSVDVWWWYGEHVVTWQGTTWEICIVLPNPVKKFSLLRWRMNRNHIHPFICLFNYIPYCRLALLSWCFVSTFGCCCCLYFCFGPFLLTHTHNILCILTLQWLHSIYIYIYIYNSMLSLHFLLSLSLL